MAEKSLGHKKQLAATCKKRAHTFVRGKGKKKKGEISASVRSQSRIRRAAIPHPDPLSTFPFSLHLVFLLPEQIYGRDDDVIHFPEKKERRGEREKVSKPPK